MVNESNPPRRLPPRQVSDNQRFHPGPTQLAVPVPPHPRNFFNRLLLHLPGHRSTRPKMGQVHSHRRTPDSLWRQHPHPAVRKAYRNVVRGRLRCLSGPGHLSPGHQPRLQGNHAGGIRNAELDHAAWQPHHTLRDCPVCGANLSRRHCSDRYHSGHALFYGGFGTR